jgi:DNA polymerase-3 subunit beta
MKFIVSSSALLKQLQQINGVIGSNNVLPILEDFLFQIEKNKLTVIATDLETVMKIHLDIEAKDSGRVCIPAKILMDSLKNLPNQPLTFDIDKNFVKKLLIKFIIILLLSSSFNAFLLSIVSIFC